MRLVCPNCEAKYEVPEDAIPESGRDVQCANCGHAWFQMRSRAGSAAVGSAAVTEPVADPVPENLPERQAPTAIHRDEAPGAAEPVEANAFSVPAGAEAANEAAAGPPLETSAEPAAAARAEPESPQDPAPAPAPVAAAAYAVDESVLAILREEAEREAEARRADARPLESQPDLGLDAAMPARQRPALVVSDGARLDALADTSTRHATRRDLLPDVEEINSTLRPSEASYSADDGQMVAAQREGRGFRSGFLVVMTVAIIGATIYLFAQQLSGMVPALAGPLEGYVSAVDGLRLALDGMMRSATVAINGE